jgi:hypothetical protein
VVNTTAPRCARQNILRRRPTIARALDPKTIARAGFGHGQPIGANRHGASVASAIPEFLGEDSAGKPTRAANF